MCYHDYMVFLCIINMYYYYYYYVLFISIMVLWYLFNRKLLQI